MGRTWRTTSRGEGVEEREEREEEGGGRGRGKVGERRGRAL